MTCKGTKTNGERCGTKFGLSHDGYCHHHNPSTLCKGKRHDGAKCNAQQKENYDYCCADHDPVNRAKRIDPNVFRLDNLRQTKMKDIVKRYPDDIYHGNKLPRYLTCAHELDHKFEDQCAAYGVREANIEDTEAEGIVIEFLRDYVLNKNDNLGFTLATTNRIKGSAVKKLLDDKRTGHSPWSTFTGYLLAEARVKSDDRVDRAVTKAIRTEMQKANKECQYKLENESEMPEMEAVKKQFKKLYVVLSD